MTEQKSWHIGYNRYSNTTIVYSSLADAMRSGTWYMEITADTLDEAKTKLLEEYKKENP